MQAAAGLEHRPGGLRRRAVQGAKLSSALGREGWLPQRFVLMRHRHADLLAPPTRARARAGPRGAPPRPRGLRPQRALGARTRGRWRRSSPPTAFRPRRATRGASARWSRASWPPSARSTPTAPPPRSRTSRPWSATADGGSRRRPSRSPCARRWRAATIRLPRRRRRRLAQGALPRGGLRRDRPFPPRAEAAARRHPLAVRRARAARPRRRRRCGRAGSTG